MQKKIIISIGAIIIILVVVFLSRQAYFKGIENNIISAATDQVQAYLAKGSTWIMSSIYPKISQDVQKRGEMIKTEVNQTKQKVTEDIPKQIENYFSGIKDAVMGKTNTSCPTPATQ